MVKDLFLFIWENKKWWLIPPIIVFIIFSLLVIFTQASPISPFVYMLF